MRTTLNIDDDVARQLAERSRSEGRSMSRVANDLMRDGLRLGHAAPELGRYEPPVFDSGAPALDMTDVGEALERLDQLG
jgi:hypothetical protein